MCSSLGDSKDSQCFAHQLTWNAGSVSVENVLAAYFTKLYLSWRKKEKNFPLTPPDEFKAFLTRLPQNFYLNTSAIHHLWLLDGMFQRRYEMLESSMKGLFKRAQRVVYKLFSLSKRCQKQPLINLPREWWAQMLCYLLIETLWICLKANLGMGLFPPYSWTKWQADSVLVQRLNLLEKKN